MDSERLETLLAMDASHLFDLEIARLAGWRIVEASEIPDSPFNVWRPDGTPVPYGAYTGMWHTWEFSDAIPAFSTDLNAAWGLLETVPPHWFIQLGTELNVDPETLQYRKPDYVVFILNRSAAGLVCRTGRGSTPALAAVRAWIYWHAKQQEGGAK